MCTGNYGVPSWGSLGNGHRRSRQRRPPEPGGRWETVRYKWVMMQRAACKGSPEVEEPLTHHAKGMGRKMPGKESGG